MAKSRAAAAGGAGKKAERRERKAHFNRRVNAVNEEIKQANNGQAKCWEGEKAVDRVRRADRERAAAQSAAKAGGQHKESKKDRALRASFSSSDGQEADLIPALLVSGSSDGAHDEPEPYQPHQGPDTQGLLEELETRELHVEVVAAALPEQPAEPSAVLEVSSKGSSRPLMQAAGAVGRALGRHPRLASSLAVAGSIAVCIAFRSRR